LNKYNHVEVRLPNIFGTGVLGVPLKQISAGRGLPAEYDVRV